MGAAIAMGSGGRWGSMTARSPGARFSPLAAAAAGPLTPSPGATGLPHALGREGEAEEEADGQELRPRGREKGRRGGARDRPDLPVLLTRDIREGETLNAIALQYCCSVRAAAPSAPRARPRPLLLARALPAAVGAGLLPLSVVRPLATSPPGSSAKSVGPHGAP